MTKQLITFFLFFSFFAATSQVEKIKQTIINCSRISENDTLIITNELEKHNLTVPLGWTGEFMGELPMLNLVNNTTKDTFAIFAYTAWDSYPKGELFDTIKFINPKAKFTKIKIEGHDFLMFTQLSPTKRLKLELMFHVDTTESFENRWVWTFQLFSPIQEVPEEIICDLKYIILQFIKWE